MASQLNQPFLSPTQPNPEQPESQTETRSSATEQPGTNFRQIIQNLTQMKSYEILTSAVRTFVGDFRSMFLMILSIVPLYLFMIFFEIKLQDIVQGHPYLLRNPSQVVYLYSYDDIPTIAYSSGRKLKFYRGNDDNGKEFFSETLQVSLFYLLLYPLLEIFVVVTTIKSTAKAHTKQTIIKESNLMGSLITYLCVHLLSVVTLLGLFWVVFNQQLVSYKSSPYGYWYEYGYGYAYEFLSIQFWVNLLSIGLHTAGFVFLLYKYLGWSASWNMAMVISVLEEDESGIEAFGCSDYYGKHCKQTGFQLMLVLFVLCNALRLPCLYFGLCSWSFGGVCVTLVVMGLFCAGNLVKWVAMVLYFYDCKRQVMEKKGDDVNVC